MSPRLTACTLPLVFVLCKFDKFLDLESVKRKALLGAIRHLAHLNGAHIVSVGRGDKRLVNDLRFLLNHCVFGTPQKKKAYNTDSSSGGVVVPAGRDSFEAIGTS